MCFPKHISLASQSNWLRNTHQMTALINTESYRKAAREFLPRFVYEYLDGAAEDELCLFRNSEDLRKKTLIPKVLRETSKLDTSIDVFDSKWKFPFGIAPTGLNGLIRPNGDGSIAAAAADMGIPFILSTASNQRLEDICEGIPNSEKWLQLYVMEDRRIAEQLVSRAKHAKFSALILTVDVPVSGFREKDVLNGFKIPMQPSLSLVADILKHPRWMTHQLLSGLPKFANLVSDPEEKLSAQSQAALLSRTMDRSLNWDDIHWLRKIWDGPILLKGVLHPSDVRMALHTGIDGLIVSNHGGRQLDVSPSSISMLPKITDVVQDRIPVFMDSGIRRGSDVVKALSLGAKAVFIGRPVLYGLAVDGQAGVKSILSLIAEELSRTMILLGASRLDEFDDSFTLETD